MVEIRTASAIVGRFLRTILLLKWHWSGALEGCANRIEGDSRRLVAHTMSSAIVKHMCGLDTQYSARSCSRLSAMSSISFWSIRRMVKLFLEEETARKARWTVAKKTRVKRLLHPHQTIQTVFLDTGAAALVYGGGLTTYVRLKWPRIAPNTSLISVANRLSGTDEDCETASPNEATNFRIKIPQISNQVLALKTGVRISFWSSLAKSILDNCILVFCAFRETQCL